MNWDNQDNKDPWGNRSNGNDQDFDDPVSYTHLTLPTTTIV